MFFLFLILPLTYALHTVTNKNETSAKDFQTIKTKLELKQKVSFL